MIDGGWMGGWMELTPYATFWNKASRLENVSWKLGSEEMVKQKRKTPVMTVLMAMVPFRPTYLMSTV